MISMQGKCFNMEHDSQSKLEDGKNSTPLMILDTLLAVTTPPIKQSKLLLMMMLIMVVYSDQILACNLMDRVGWVRLV